MANTSRWAFVAAAAVVAGCEVPDTATGLRPEGPPMIQQVFMSELTDAGSGVFRRTDGVLAFGWHPNVPNGRIDLGEVDDRTHPVTSALAATQTIRIVFDELLVGNGFEEISCRNRQWSKVPIGATPDDIANCAVPNDLLPQFCTGPMAVCVFDGVPVGVTDEDENGSPDDTRMICDQDEPVGPADPLYNVCTRGPVRLRCGNIDVPFNRQLTFWQPAGNQLVPARQTPQTSLGPALIFSPMARALPMTPGLLPPGSTCHFEFSGAVTDKDGNAVCVPKNGMEDTDDLGECEPGDMTGFEFGTEAMRRDTSSPSRGATGVPVTRRSTYIELSSPVEAASFTAADVVVMEGTTRRNDVTVTVAPTPQRLNVTLGADMLPNTTYTITITGVNDIFGQPVTGTFDNSFTTAP